MYKGNNYHVLSVKPEKFRDGHITRLVAFTPYGYADHIKALGFLGKSVKLTLTDCPEQLELGEASEKKFKVAKLKGEVMTVTKVEAPEQKGGRITKLTMETPWDLTECSELMFFLKHRVILEMEEHVESGEVREGSPEEDTDEDVDISM
jgi:hypothetical protein